MNILVVSEPGVDGVFRYVEALCHFLLEQGAAVHLAYSDRRPSDGLFRLVGQVAEKGGAAVNLRTGNRPGPADLRAFLVLLRTARVLRPDVIHSHSSKAGALARMLPIFGSRSVQVYHPHAYIGLRPSAGHVNGVYNAVEAAFGRLSHTVVCSEGERAFAIGRLRIPPSRVSYLPHGVDTDRFSPVTDGQKRRIREKLGLPWPAQILGFLGRSSPQKDPCTLYRAFAQVAVKRPIALFHVGRGELDPELERLARESGAGGRVYRLPYTSSPAEFYQAVDGFILTSLYEGFSLAVLEALSADLPLILSDAPGNRDLFDLSLSHAWRAEPGDSAAFARAIGDWSDRIARPEPVNHRRIAREVFDHRARMEDLMALYEALLRRRSPQR